VRNKWFTDEAHVHYNGILKNKTAENSHQFQVKTFLRGTRHGVLSLVHPEETMTAEQYPDLLRNDCLPPLWTEV
jgi:hypothetical protein